MSQNLAEFLKVLMIVVTWSAALTIGRHYILKDFDSVDEPEGFVDNAEEEEVI